MNVKATTKDGKVYHLKDGKWSGKVTVPAEIHARLLRGMNKLP